MQSPGAIIASTNKPQSKIELKLSELAMIRRLAGKTRSHGDAKRQPSGQWCRGIQLAMGGFTMIEILMVLVMSGIMILAALSTISLLDRSSRRQALDTGAMELAQGRIEELQSTKYNPPIAPFYATNWTQTTNVVLLLNK